MKTVDTHGTYGEAISGSSSQVQEIAGRLRDLIIEVYPDVTEVPWPKQKIIGYGAGLVFLAVANLSHRPAPVYFGISLVVLVISLFLPFRMPRPPVPISTPLVLASIYVVGTALLVPILIAVGLPAKGGEREYGKSIQ